MNPPLKALLSAALAFATSTALADYVPPVTHLRSALQIQLHGDDSHTRIIERHIRIDTERGIQSAGEQRQSYSGSLQTLEVLEAWSQSADGKRKPVNADKIKTLEESDDGTAEFSDGKVNVVIFPALQVGSEIYVKYRIHQHTPYFKGHFDNAVVVPPHTRFLNVSVELTHQANTNLNWQVRGFAGGQVAALPSDPAGTIRHRYTYEQPDFIKPESGLISKNDFAPALFVTTFKDYAELARAYYSGARARSEPTPAIRKLALELTAQAKTPEQKVRALYNWVSRQIRYVFIVVGTGGYIPHEAQSVLDNRYGDCKDHAVILEALLRAVGIESSAVLINAGKSYRLPSAAVLSVFDHVITYVPSLNLFLDSTARFSPMGTLPDEVEDKPALITATGEILRTPMPNVAEDITHTRFWMQVTAEGRVWGSSLATMGGSTQTVSRGSQFSYKNRPMDTVVSRLLARFGETGTGRITTPDPSDLDAPWKVEAVFDLDPVVNVPGPSAMTIPVGLGPANLHDLKGSTVQDKRQLQYVCAAAATYRDEVELRLPPKVKIERIPPNAAIRVGAVSYRSTYRLNGQVVHVFRELKVDRKRSVCDVKDDREWAQVLPVLQRDLRGQIFFK